MDTSFFVHKSKFGGHPGVAVVQWVKRNYPGGEDMELGERIKQARLEAGLSQRQLCGDRLTRNMLSLIENGSARPSMDTLRYFAGRLGKPVGWFLEEQAVVSPNQERMAAARQSWVAGDAAGVLTALEDYRTPDETFDSEKALLSYLACLSLARQALDEGRLPYGVHLLEQAGQQSSPYITPAQEQARQLLLARVGQPAQLDCDDTLLARAELVLKSDPGRALDILGAAQDRNSARWLYLAGQARLARKEYAAAAEALSAVEAVFSQAVPLLEICWRELGDFKKAYEYACKGRQ